MHCFRHTASALQRDEVHILLEDNKFLAFLGCLFLGVLDFLQCKIFPRYFEIFCVIRKTSNRKRLFETSSHIQPHLSRLDFALRHGHNDMVNMQLGRQWWRLTSAGFGHCTKARGVWFFLWDHPDLTRSQDAAEAEKETEEVYPVGEENVAILQDFRQSGVWRTTYY